MLDYVYTDHAQYTIKTYAKMALFPLLLTGPLSESRILAPLDHRCCNVRQLTYALLVACTGTPAVPTALGVPYDYAPAVARVLGPTIAMSVTILKL